MSHKFKSVNKTIVDKPQPKPRNSINTFVPILSDDLESISKYSPKEIPDAVTVSEWKHL